MMDIKTIQEMFAQHFIHFQSFEGDTKITLDSYLPLFEKIFSLTAKDGFLYLTHANKFKKVSSNDALLDYIMGIAFDIVGLTDRDIVYIHKEFQDSIKCFVKKKQKSFIQYDISFSVLVSVLCIIYLKYVFLKDINHNNDEIGEHENVAKTELFNSLIWLKQELDQWFANDNKIKIEFSAPLSIGPHEFNRFLFYFLEAILFIVFHELGHIVLNHSGISKNYEFEADAFAIEKLIEFQKRNRMALTVPIGPYLVLLGVSLFQSPICENKSHPSLLKRFINISEKIVELSDDSINTHKFIMKANVCPFYRTLLSNLNDSKIFESWFGYTIKEFEQNIPKNNHYDISGLDGLLKEFPNYQELFLKLEDAKYDEELYRLDI